MSVFKDQNDKSQLTMDSCQKIDIYLLNFKGSLARSKLILHVIKVIDIVDFDDRNFDSEVVSFYILSSF